MLFSPELFYEPGDINTMHLVTNYTRKSHKNQENLLNTTILSRDRWLGIQMLQALSH